MHEFMNKERLQVVDIYVTLFSLFVEYVAHFLGKVIEVLMTAQKIIANGQSAISIIFLWKTSGGWKFRF